MTLHCRVQPLQKQCMIVRQNQRDNSLIYWDITNHYLKITVGYSIMVSDRGSVPNFKALRVKI